MTTETKAALDALMRAFEAFKDTNDRRLAELERHGSGDAVTAEKLTRIDAALDEHKTMLDRLALEGARPPLAPERAAARSGFERFMRAGDPSGLSEAKALDRSSGAAGGYLAPQETEAVIERLITPASPMRAVASVRKTDRAVFRQPVSLGGAGGGWAAETAQRLETEAPTLDLLEVPSAELYAMPAATSALLDDAFVDIEQWLAEEVRDVFAETENDAFINGDGVNKPKGLLSHVRKPLAEVQWGEIGYVGSGLNGALNTTDPAEQFLSMIYAHGAAVRANGRFMMSRSVLSAARRLKDADGSYLWSPSQQPGEDSRLLGYPVVENEAMPGLAPGGIAAAFGDFSRAYLVVDHQGLEVLRDPYSAKPFVLFYTTKRVGGAVRDPSAVTLLRLANV